MHSIPVLRAAAALLLVAFGAAAGCSRELDTNATDGGTEEARGPVLVVRSSQDELELTPLSDIPARVRHRALGPVFEVSASQEPLELTLHARDAWPTDLEAPRGLDLVWHGADGATRTLDTDHDEPTRAWRATLRTGDSRGHVFLAGPEVRRVPSTECALAVAPEALAARIERCGEDQLGRVNELRLHLCAMGTAIEPASLDRAVRELPCEPSLSDFQTLLPEALR